MQIGYNQISLCFITATGELYYLTDRDLCRFLSLFVVEQKFQQLVVPKKLPRQNSCHHNHYEIKSNKSLKENKHKIKKKDASRFFFLNN
jgi:hypothetical protein